jgi:hypothetical protein
VRPSKLWSRLKVAPVAPVAPVASEPVKSTKPAEARSEAKLVQHLADSANVLRIHEDPLASLDGLSQAFNSLLKWEVSVRSSLTDPGRLFGFRRAIEHWHTKSQVFRTHAFQHHKSWRRILERSGKYQLEPASTFKF